MNPPLEVSQREEPITHDEEQLKHMNGSVQQEQVVIPTHAELSPSLAWSQQNLLSLGSYLQ
jgi:hypothetical protein